MTDTVAQADWVAQLADELHKIALDILGADAGDLPAPRLVQLHIQPGGPQGDDDKVIAGVDAIAQAVLGKTGETVEMSPRGIYHYNAEGRRGPIFFSVYREISTSRVERLKTDAELAEKERELERLRAEVEKLRADQSGLDYSRPADGDEPQSLDARRVPSRFQHGRDAGVDELPPVELPTVHLALDGDTACEKQVANLPKTDGHSSDHADVTCRECLEAVPY